MFFGGAGGDFPFTLAQKDFAKAQTTQTPTVDHDPGVSSSHQAALWGRLGEKGGTILGPDLWRQTRVTTTEEGGDETSRRGTDRFIYHNSAIALPIPDSQCKCWTFREKITSPGEGAVGEKLSRLQ